MRYYDITLLSSEYDTTKEMVFGVVDPNLIAGLTQGIVTSITNLSTNISRKKDECKYKHRACMDKCRAGTGTILGIPTKARKACTAGCKEVLQKCETRVIEEHKREQQRMQQEQMKFDKDMEDKRKRNMIIIVSILAITLIISIIIYKKSKT